MAKTWRDAFGSWWATARQEWDFPVGADEHTLAELAYAAGRDCGRAEMQADIERLQQWVSDCQAGMYINCVYCGHRYGPDDEVPATMADVLKEHIERCPSHPMSHLKIERDDLARALFKIRRLTMRGRGDETVAAIACGAVQYINETPLFTT